MVQGLVLLVHPNASVAEPWKTTLILYTFILLAVGFNIFCAQHLPLAEGKSRQMVNYQSGTDQYRRTALRPYIWLLRLPTHLLDHGGSRTRIAGLYGV